jgi:hypothetical protein
MWHNCSERVIEDSCVVKAHDIAFKNTEKILAEDLLHYSLPINRFTPKYQ